MSMKPHYFTIIALFLFGFALQSTGSAIHHTLHVAEKYRAANTQAATVDDQSCDVCDSLQTRDVPAPVVTLTCAPLYPLHDFKLPSAALTSRLERLPLGARAPPALIQT